MTVPWFSALRERLARRIDPGAYTALHAWQELAEKCLVEQGQLKTALAKAMGALRRHDDWCGYHKDAPGDSSYNDAWRSFEALDEQDEEIAPEVANYRARVDAFAEARHPELPGTANSQPKGDA